jgi:hypothetical protein
MQQLDLPLNHQRLATVKHHATGLLDYIRKHPGDLLLAAVLVLLIDIEGDVDQLLETPEVN